MSRYLAVACCLLISSCSLPKDIVEEKPRDGIVVVGFGADQKSTFSGYNLYIRSVDYRFGTGVPFTVRGLAKQKPDFADGSEEGVMWATRLPAGQYEIYDVTGVRGDTFWETETHPLKPVSIRFWVLPGTTIYLGHYRVATGGDVTNAPIALEATDENQSDIARARRKYPELGEVAVTIPPAVRQSMAQASTAALATP